MCDMKISEKQNKKKQNKKQILVQARREGLVLVLVLVILRCV
jgi:hypothetical protein